MSILVGNPFLLNTTAATGYQVSRSLRFNAGDSANLSKTFASAGNQTTWTLSCWFKLCSPGSNFRVTPLFSGSSPWGGISIYQDKIRFAAYNGAYIVHLHTTQVLRDPSAWYHLVAVFDSNNGTSGDRARLYLNGSRITTFSTETYPSSGATTTINSTGQQYIGYEESNAVYSNCYFADYWFLDGVATDASSFAETNATTGQWIPKAYTGSKGTNGFHLEFADNSAATAAALGKDTSGNGNNWTPNNFTASATVYSNSTTNVTNPKNAFDGSLSTSASNSGDPANPMVFSSLGLSGVTTFEYYTTDSGTYDVAVNGGSFSTDAGGSGWRSLSSPPSTISSVSIKNTAGSPNTAVVRAFRVNSTVLVDGVPANIDSLVDTPTSYGTDDSLGGSVRGNYCTWNPLSPVNATYANGNLEVTPGDNGRANATMSVSSGKWYWEATLTARSSTPSYNLIGIGDISDKTEAGVASTSWVYRDDGKKMNSNSAVNYGASYAVNDVIGIAWDADNGTLTFYKNGSSQGQAYSGISGNYGPIAGRNSTFTATYAFNFGQRAWAYTPPANHRPLVDTLLPTPVVAKPNTVMDVKLYTGNGSTQTISGLGFSPDFVWIKQRSGGAWHFLTDAVRGAGKVLNSNVTNAEDSYSGGTTAFSAFTSDGFSIGQESNWLTNTSSATYAAWCWDAGTSTTTINANAYSAGVPSITSSVRANASAGFSIVTWTGTGSLATIGHGLGVAPSFIVIKRRNAATDWDSYHASLGNTQGIALNSTAAASTGSGYWNNTSPTSTVFTVNTGVQANGGTYVAYCFAPVAGYSSMGSYVGNGSSDGVFVYTGFRPAFVMLKASSTTGNWVIEDNRINNYNTTGGFLLANTSGAEDSGGFIDFLSNGFKLRLTSANFNGNGTTYIYYAAAESPFQYARAR